MARRGYAHYQMDLQSCYQASQRANLDTCLAGAEDERKRGLYAGFGIEYDNGRDWSYGWYFRKMWRFLAAEIVLPPVAIYGFLRLLAFIGNWIWRGSKPKVMRRSPTSQV